MIIYKLKEYYEQAVLPNIGIILSLISQLFNCLMVMFCKLLLNDKDFETPIHPLQILFVRMLITYIFCLSYLIFIEKNNDLPFGPKKLRFLLFLRALGGFISVCGQYWSLIYLNVSDTVVILFLEPTITAFMAWITLGEIFTKIEAIGGLIAFFGVLLIAKPPFLLYLFHLKENNKENLINSSNNLRLIGTCLALLSCFGTGISMCSMRKIGFQIHPLFMVSVYALFTIIGSFIGILLIPGLSFQIPHNFKQWSFLIIIGITGFFMQFLLTASIQRERASIATAMIYTQLIYASIFDYFVNNIIPKGLTLIGEIIIIFAVFNIVYFKESNVIIEPIVVVDLERDIQLETYQDFEDLNIIQDTPSKQFDEFNEGMN
ncbi:hypothetical protein C6P40_003609 [Pichia californica]|uniref:EamA domain-containing protein n=1 Tax=Pichia californica TaxID=460514 RepID=A0A9P7BET3_9ASCO|nr:hypothetical protein C6P42_002539 [[Candida] californica]KAG0686673.1 hypothetical protein C6P40_003609 [[Candida] californica]